MLAQTRLFQCILRGAISLFPPHSERVAQFPPPLREISDFFHAMTRILELSSMLYAAECSLSASIENSTAWLSYRQECSAIREHLNALLDAQQIENP